jgi:hypothetical protein
VIDIGLAGAGSGAPRDRQQFFDRSLPTLPLEAVVAFAKGFHDSARNRLARFPGDRFSQSVRLRIFYVQCHFCLYFCLSVSIVFFLYRNLLLHFLCDTLLCVERRNLTVSLPKETIRKARVFAAQHDTTLNRLVQDVLEEKIEQEDRMLAACEKLLELAKRGPHFSGDPGKIDRDELHERW